MIVGLVDVRMRHVPYLKAPWASLTRVIVQIRDQFYYVVALNQQRSRIVKLLQRVNYTCHNIVRTGRLKQNM